MLDVGHFAWDIYFPGCNVYKLSTIFFNQIISIHGVNVAVVNVIVHLYGAHVHQPLEALHMIRVK